MRFLLANFFKKDTALQVDFDNINSLTSAGDMQAAGQAEPHLIPAAPLFVKIHSSYAGLRDKRFSKAIYICRNGYDMLLSYWHFTAAQNPDFFRNIYEFSKCYWWYCGHWGDHARSWLTSATETSRILFIKYEDMIADVEKVLVDLLEFLQIRVDGERIAEAIKASDRSNMKRLPGSQRFMKAPDSTMHFVRSARSGEGVDSLPEACKRTFLSYRSNYSMMRELRYDTGGPEWDRMKKLTYIPLSQRALYYAVRLRRKLRKTSTGAGNG
jgi:hypothetical protein